MYDPQARGHGHHNIVQMYDSRVRGHRHENIFQMYDMWARGHRHKNIFKCVTVCARRRNKAYATTVRLHTIRKRMTIVARHGTTKYMFNGRLCGRLCVNIVPYGTITILVIVPQGSYIYTQSAAQCAINMYFVVPCRATIVIRLRIVWSHTVVAYALCLCRAHTLSSCSGVPVHGASVQGYTARACRGARREHAGARPMHKVVVAEPIGFRDD